MAGSSRIALLLLPLAATTCGCNSCTRLVREGAQPAPASQPASAPAKPLTLDEALREAHDHVKAGVKAGFATRSEIVASVQESLSDEYDGGDLKGHVEKLTDEALAIHHRAQAAWPRTTDCDRLDAAFAALERDGILARQNFTCCQTCGHAEIGEEVEKARARGRAVRGYVFYHSQDTESVVDSGDLMLAYGAVAEGDPAILAIGDAIVAALRKAGLKVRWERDVKKRIEVHELEWLRRRPPGK